jgi:hypothetical protein
MGPENLLGPKKSLKISVRYDTKRKVDKGLIDSINLNQLSNKIWRQLFFFFRFFAILFGFSSWVLTATRNASESETRRYSKSSISQLQEPILRLRFATPRVALRVLKTKIFYSTLKNTIAYYNAGDVHSCKFERLHFQRTMSYMCQISLGLFLTYNRDARI